MHCSVLSDDRTNKLVILHEQRHDSCVQNLRTFMGEIMMPTIDSFLATWSPRVLSIVRIMVGLLFLEHGTSK